MRSGTSGLIDVVLPFSYIVFTQFGSGTLDGDPLALSVADRALVMENGRFVLEGTAEEISKDPDVREFYLGISTQDSVKGYQRYRRKKRWR